MKRLKLCAVPLLLTLALFTPACQVQDPISPGDATETIEMQTIQEITTPLIDGEKNSERHTTLSEGPCSGYPNCEQFLGSIDGFCRMMDRITELKRQYGCIEYEYGLVGAWYHLGWQPCEG